MSDNTILNSLPSKTAFIVGFLAAILALGTLGFIFLGSCFLSSSCDFSTNETKTVLADAEQNANVIVADEQPDEANAPIALVPKNSIPEITDTDLVQGEKNAPVTIVEYSDFQCPYCQQFHTTLNEVMKKYPGKVRWVFRHYPLGFHPQAQSAAEASECAAEQGKFWEFADELFANQDKFGSDYYKQVAAELVKSPSKFNDCVDARKYADKVRQDAAGGTKAGVNATPGSYIMGAGDKAQKLRGALPADIVHALVEEIL